MKRVVLFLICMMAFATNAQEKQGGFAAEIGMGAAHYGNYPSVSVFADPTDNYRLIASEQIAVGYHGPKGWFAGLSLGGDGGNTAFLNRNERFSNYNIMLEIRDYFKLNERLEIEAGVAFGLLVHNNRFEYANELFSFTRLGACGHLSTGLNYIFKENHYIGIRAIFPRYGLLLDNKPNLPMGLEATDKTQSVGYSLQLIYGIRF